MTTDPTAPESLSAVIEPPANLPAGTAVALPLLQAVPLNAPQVAGFEAGLTDLSKERLNDAIPGDCDDVTVTVLSQTQVNRCKLQATTTSTAQIIVGNILTVLQGTCSATCPNITDFEGTINQVLSAGATDIQTALAMAVSDGFPPPLLAFAVDRIVADLQCQICEMHHASYT